MDNVSWFSAGGGHNEAGALVGVVGRDGQEHTSCIVCPSSLDKILTFSQIMTTSASEPEEVSDVSAPPNQKHKAAGALDGELSCDWL